ncbi:putative guanyl-specific ribonuclease f1 [Golovinomyces cichoracearum]|uniref:Putative guanyl-specific ribonuclease f1 n=1 Tax=Golovinomyces cichoracearum TaxID=62708 RepID=A0A420HZB4_9PEZI|nr:putative guanyl-specific ribonuclease f1 [Golovinomyces cichoracearum]
MLFFLALSVILFTTLLQVVPVATTEPASNFELGFDCEEDFISDAEITNVLIISKMAHPKFPSPNPYYGPHFWGDRLLMYPVVTHKRPEEIKSEVAKYFVVYQNPGHVVGVFALTQYNEHVPCSRNAFTPHTPPALDPTHSLLHMNVAITGFQCGLDAIENELILSKLVFTTRWRKRKSDRYARYVPFPEPIPGLEGPNLMWLLTYTDDPNSREEREARNPIYLITDKFGSFVQVSFMLVNGKHARCNVKTIPNTIFPTLRTNHRGNLQMGYLCDVFFDDNYLSKCANAAREQDQMPLVYPKPEYLGPKIGNVFVWPIFSLKSIDTQARNSRYFLVLSKNFKVLRVLKYSRNHGYRNCLRQGIEKNQEPEKSDFICDNNKVANEYLREAAKIACQGILTKKPYPKIYRGPRFDVVGPYLISQQITELSNRAKAKFRAIITHDCTLAGAVVKTAKGLKKCSRVDGSMPGGDSEYQITELSRDMDHVKMIYKTR